MKQIEKAYAANAYEDKIYKKWEKSGAFTPQIDKKKKPFTITLPPPNATGTLHLGHATMLAIEDIMVRQKRMEGYSTLWLPGTDHAAIATQSIVERKLQSEGIANPREELGRKKLISEIKKYVEVSKGTIRNQIRKMGASVDWTREKYTLDDDLNHAVNTFFSMMYSDGLIYQGDRIVNWDPAMQTTVADDELEYKEEKAKFYYFQYGPVVIGTARPETKFSDKVIVVHPNDKRYKHLHNKEFVVEWINGPINAKVVTDSCVDPKMGTGAMTITPGHSVIDFELAEKHKLEKEQIIDFNGKLNEVAGEFAGMHIDDAREKIVAKLKKKGLLVKVDENYMHNIAVNYRGKGTVEPQIMKQWFVDVNKKVIQWKGEEMSIKEVMQDTVKSGMIKMIPKRFDKIYYHWIDNLRDWCISRQIWWGHQIPIWYCVSPEDKKRWEKHTESSSYLLQSMGIKISATKFSETEPKKGSWIRDPDTLDTWFSSALWTFSTLGWPKHTKELEYFHPTNVLETGYDIIFFWVARMILASTYCLRKDGLPEEKCLPFKEVYLHGLIRDIRGKKMSKSNPETAIDPLDMIEKYGTDAVRLSLIVGNTPGNDMRLYEEKIAGYRNFINKIWNAARFSMVNLTDFDLDTTDVHKKATGTADKWMLSKLNELIGQVNKDMKNYRYSDAATNIYNFTWGQYCDWYLEISKGEHINPHILLYVLKTLLKLLHPFVPFVTEAIWGHLGEQKLLINEEWPKQNAKHKFSDAVAEMEILREIISSIRSIRAEKGVENSKLIDVVIYGGLWTDVIKEKRESIIKMCRLNSLNIETEGEKLENSVWKFIDGINIFVPIKGLFDAKKELLSMNRECVAMENQVKNLKIRLNNKNFTDKAPPSVVEKDKKNYDDLEKKLHFLKEKIKELKHE